MCDGDMWMGVRVDVRWRHVDGRACGSLAVAAGAVAKLKPLMVVSTAAGCQQQQDEDEDEDEVAKKHVSINQGSKQAFASRGH